MSVKSSHSDTPRGRGVVVKSGCLRKLKNSKRKYFVLRAAETCESSARLEYYDSEKKYNNGQLPKRSIPIKTCFNINKRHDIKHNKHVIALYTKDDCFCVILENEEESDAWLKALLAEQQGEEVPDGVMPRPTFEHIWQVQLLNRGISTMVPGYKTTSELVLTHRLCLTDKTLSLIKQEENGVSQTDFPLTLIRSCGSLKNYFYLEAGRSSVIGAGEIWMEAEDSHIASNIYHTVFNTMNSSSSREELAPQSRNRSSSANEASKPNNMPRRQTMAAGTPKPIPSYQHQDQTVNIIIDTVSTPCTSANNNNHSNANAGNVAWPGIVNHQRTRSLPLAHPAPITTDNPIHPPKAAKRPTQSSKCFTDSRIRCDSMPSRPRTSSEGNHPLMIVERHWPSGHPQLSRDISHSPPSDSPVSPPSVACSTDSAGSSLSIDDSEGWHDSDIHRRFPISLTPDEAIAEENCDDCAESPCRLHSSPTLSSYVPMSTGHAPNSSDDGYVDMSPRARHITMSPAPSMSSVTSGTPSTDMLMSTFKLVKVYSFIPSEEEETSSNERQRTYSMGSKPYRTRIDQPRNRACSVGSKAKKGYNRVLPPHGHNYHGAKSSSAPLLSNTRMYSSHSSIDPMEDLMEMDFSRKPNSDYVEMTPSSRSSNTSQNQNKNKGPSGYVDMKPGAPMLIEKSEPSSYVEMRPSTSPSKPIQIILNTNKIKPSTSPQNPSLSPLSSIASTSPLSQYTPTTDYMDMNFHPKNNNLDNYVASPVRSTLSYINPGSPSSIDYIDMEYQPTIKKETEGYVEMSLGSGGGGRTPTAVGDYTNMSFGSSRKNQQNHVKSKNDSNTRSKPINIQQPTSSYDKLKSMILPLQNSLPKPRSRKNSRRDSKDSSSSSVTTPSSSSTIFPLSLNSPSSPVCSKSPETRTPTATTTTTTTTTSSRIKVPTAVLNTKYQSSGFRRGENSDYALMSFDGNVEHPNYVNYRLSTLKSTAPATSPTTTTASTTCSNPWPLRDYALMQPGSNMRLKSTNSRCYPTTAATAAGTSQESRPSSDSSEVSTLVGSRPNSVNSASGGGLEQGQQLHYASLDLAAATDAGADDESSSSSKSPRTPKSATTGGEGAIEANFAYAEIDFARSDGFKTPNSLMNTRVKH